MKKPLSQNISNRPGTLGYYLLQAGWEPVEQEDKYPLWRRGEDTVPVTGVEALLEVYRDIWRHSVGKGGDRERQPWKVNTSCN